MIILHNDVHDLTPACTECGAEVESVGHFILQCPAWDQLRQELLGLYKLLAHRHPVSTALGGFKTEDGH